MCNAKYRPHTEAVGPMGVKPSSTGPTSSSNIPNEFSSYTFVERTLMAIGSGKVELDDITQSGTELTGADIHRHDVEYP